MIPGCIAAGCFAAAPAAVAGEPEPPVQADGSGPQGGDEGSVDESGKEAQEAVDRKAHDSDYLQHHRSLKEQDAPLSEPGDHDSVRPHAH